MTALVGGVLLGLAGSAHCAGMCGPLVLTVVAGRARLAQLLAYHVGRVSMYLLLATAAGLAGHALTFGGLGRAVSIGSGVLLLMAATGSGSLIRSSGIGWLWSLTLTRACVWASHCTRAHPLAGHLLSGIINGLLPCGLVYAAAIAAAGFGNVSSAVTFMAGFGLGTTPVLLAISLSAASFPPALRLRLRRLAPAALVLAGAILIVRGLRPPHHSAEYRDVPVAISHVH